MYNHNGKECEEDYIYVHVYVVSLYISLQQYFPQKFIPILLF